MNCTIWKLAAALAAFAFSSPAFAQCDAGMLNGDYIYVVRGTVVTPIPALQVPAGPVVVLGVLKIADGKFTGTVIQNFNGNVTPPVKVSGVITVNEDCTGTALDSTGISYMLAIGTDAQEVTLAPLVPGAVLMGTAKRR